MDLLISVLEQGFVYGIAALGAYISYKILDFPDLSVEGTFPLGAAVAVFLIMAGFNPYAACVVAALFGAVAGMATGIIHVKLRVSDLQSGIIMLTGLYSVNLLINDKANVPIYQYDTIFTASLPGFLSPIMPDPFKKVWIACMFFLVAKLLLDVYLKTKSGFLLRASGDNSQYVTLLGEDAGKMKIIGLSLANALAALSGAVTCQYQRLFDISMGTGIIVTALSSVIIGMSIFKRFRFMKATTMSLLGCLIYRACYALAITAGVDSKYMKLITALLFLVSLVVSRSNGKGRRLRHA